MQPSEEPNLVELRHVSMEVACVDVTNSFDVTGSTGTTTGTVKSFKIRDEVLRAAKLSETLKGFGRFWRIPAYDLNEDQRRKMFAKSMQTDKIDVFLSQTWRTPGYRKYFALVTLFYQKPAVIVHVTLLVLLGFMDLFRLLPVAEVAPRTYCGHAVTAEVSPWCFVPSLLGLLTLFIAPEVGCGSRDPMVFFDAVCINQVDEDKKAEGIHSIGGFIAKSERLCVLWSDPYFTRLWCVYEIAAFVKSRGTRKIDWRPLCMLCSRFWWQVALVVGFGMEGVLLYTDLPASSRYMATFVSAALPVLCAVLSGRNYSKESLNLEAQLDAFDFALAECGEEADREQILKCAQHWFGDESAFNSFVRGPVKKHVMETVYNYRDSYWCSVAVSLPAVSYTLQWAIAYARSDMSIEGVVSWVAGLAVMPFVCLPLASKILRKCCEFSGAPLASCVANLAVNVMILCITLGAVASAAYISVAMSNHLRLGGVHLAVFSTIILIFILSPRGSCLPDRNGEHVSTLCSKSPRVKSKESKSDFTEGSKVPCHANELESGTEITL